jgi:hypothetical protein
MEATPGRVARTMSPTAFQESENRNNGVAARKSPNNWQFNLQKTTFPLS